MIRHLAFAFGLAAVLAAALPADAAPQKGAPVRTAPVPRPAAPRFTIDSAVGDLMDDPRARAVMDKHFPNLKKNPHYFLIEDRSVRQLGPISGGKLTPAVLAKIDAELRAIP